MPTRFEVSFTRKAEQDIEDIWSFIAEDSPDDATTFIKQLGMFMDRFVTSNQPGLLLLHGYGDVFERVLRPGESIMMEPGAFLYKDSSVTMNIESQQLTTGFFGGTGMNLARMTGPGRVGIQSMYVHHATE